MHIFLCAGDDSGDLHASSLMVALRRLEPHVRFSGVGMRRMKRAGLQCIEDQDEWGSALWLHNLLRLGRFKRLLKRCKEFLHQHKPDLVVPVDFGGFNTLLCRAARKARVPVLYYVPPQVWAHGAYRIKKLARCVDRFAVIYPFEREFYRQRGLDVEYVGHPLFDEIEAEPPDEGVVADLRERFGERLIGIFPGSREQEVRRHLPIMTAACSRLRSKFPEAAFALVCPERLGNLVGELLAASPVEVAQLDIKTTELARAALLCVTKSGTITLEIASQLKPMVILYKVGGFTYFVASGLTQTRYIGLVNTLASRMICPEKVMWRREDKWVAAECARLMGSEDEYGRPRRELQQVMKDFARPGASERTARLALRMAGA